MSIFFHVIILHDYRFFSRFFLSRKYKIQIVAHVEGKSVALLSGIMEASYRLFFIGQGFSEIPLRYL